MGIFSILAAALAAWVFGAGYYMLLAKPWVKASGIQVDENGRPTNNSPLPYILSGIAMIIVAGFMRHVFMATGISTAGAGFLAGFGVGAFFISPWIMINNAYGDRPFMLTVIDAGYAIFGCAIIGLVLTLFV